MNKFTKYFAIFACTAMFITTAAYSLTSYESSLALKRSALSCSRYIHNPTNTDTIYQIVGWYNRRCIVRGYTLNSSMECVLKKDDLKEFASAIPVSKIDALIKSDKKIEEIQVYNFEDFKKFIENETCKLTNE